MPKRQVSLVEDGVLKSVVWDRETAARADDGVESTGHAPPDAWKYLGPQPFALSMDGWRGGLVRRAGRARGRRRLRHASPLPEHRPAPRGHPHRDDEGRHVRIRDGKVAEPLVNLRFTVALPDVLADVPGLTREPLLVNQNELYDDRYPFAARVPGIATAKFNITGTGSGPGL